MIIALAILALAIVTYHIAKVHGKPKLNTGPVTHVVMLLTLLLSIAQIVFGTEVREKIDAVASHLQGGYRENWIADAGSVFTQHRDVAILVLIANVVLFALIRTGFSRHSIQQQLMSFTFLIIMLQIVTGIILSYWSLPPVAQASHIILASLVFGAQFYLMLNLYQSTKTRGAIA
jgi:cytochrome c oxidase assembly protein subunit 15